MAKGFFYDDEDESGTPSPPPRPSRMDDNEDEPAVRAIPPYSFAPADSFDTRSYVARLFKTPLFGATLDQAPGQNDGISVSHHQNALRPAPQALFQRDRLGDATDLTTLADHTTLGRQHLPVVAPDDLPSDEVTKTQSRQPNVGTIPPTESALAVGNDRGFMAKAIDTIATAIGNAVRAYSAGTAEHVDEVPRHPPAAIGNRSSNASLPNPDRSPLRPLRQYAETLGVDSDTQSAKDDDKQYESQPAAKLPQPLRDFITSDRTDLQELIADVIATGRMANTQKWKLIDRHRALRDFSLRIAESTDAASPLRWQLIEGTKAALTPSRSSEVDIEREFVRFALGKRIDPAANRIGDDTPRNGTASSTAVAIDPGGRRMPEPSQSSFVLADRFSIEPPVSPLAELRRYIGRIHAVAAFKDDGTPLMSDDEVSKFIRQASAHIRPDHRALLQVTLLAVRTGTIPWWQAQERLREYYVPESSNEALVNGVLDVLPIIGQVRGAIEVGDALDGLRIAVEEGDEVGARRFASEAALLMAGLMPLLKVGKFANRIPGVEGLKDVLGELAGGRLPFHEFLARWNKSWKLHGHHSFPIFLGGPRKDGIAKLRANVHHDLHRELNRFLRSVTDEVGNDMSPRRGNSGTQIRENFVKDRRVLAMANFYTGPGDKLRFRNAKREFFRLFPDYGK